MTSLSKTGAGSDHVTGLCSRGELESLLADVQPGRSPSPAGCLALLICDIVGLKGVNASAGFHAGDAMLAAAAGLLRAAAADADMLARLGGDELVAVFLGENAARRAASAAEKLHRHQEDARADSAVPHVRSAWSSARPEESSASLIDRLYASMRAS